MLRIWGRRNSVNVQKVLWACAELGIDYERVDAGMAFGRVDEPGYRAMNPNGRIPTIEDGDFVLWESNAILRYLANRSGADAIYPAAPRPRAGVDRWLDWQLSTLQPAERDLFWGMVRSSPAERDTAAVGRAATASAGCWRLVDRQLATRACLEGDHFTLADLVLGAYARRWFGVEMPAGFERPDLPHLARWYEAVAARPGFRLHLAAPLT